MDPQSTLEELCTNERIVGHNSERRIGFAKKIGKHSFYL